MKFVIQLRLPFSMDHYFLAHRVKITDIRNMFLTVLFSMGRIVWKPIKNSTFMCTIFDGRHYCHAYKVKDSDISH